MLSDSQLASLAELGDAYTAKVGDVLYRVGDQRYPFIAIIEGEVAIVDAARREALQTVAGLGLQIVGPHSSAATMRMLDFLRSNRLPFTWQDEVPADGDAPVVRLPGGAELRAPSPGEVLRALGIGRELAPREEVDLLVVGGGPAASAPRRSLTALRRRSQPVHDS